jgi:endonuclease/exonuclease/phosphatase family metal-dependent hydrolase
MSGSNARPAGRAREAGLAALALVAGAAHGQLRVATYNITDYPSAGTRAAELATVLYGVSPGNGLTLRPDVLVVQEVESVSGASTLRTVLNNAHIAATGGPAVWNNVAFAPPSGCADTANVLFYRTDKVAWQLTTIASVGGCGTLPPRNAPRWEIVPVGYPVTARSTLSIYGVHFKAGSTTTDQQRRLVEGQRLAANANALPAGRHFILAGDLNIGTSNEESYKALVGPTPGLPTGPFFDPIYTPGNWFSSGFRFVHTQDPAQAMDDRYDQILISSSLADSDGFSYIGDVTRPYSTTTWNDPNHSYRAWGNDGTSYNFPLRTVGNAMVGEVIAQALRTAAATAGHVPVYLDLRVPARIGASTLTIDFGTVPVGAAASSDIVVTNTGDTALWNAAGIATLRYTLAPSSGFGAPAGTFTDNAGGGGNTHAITMDTSTPGPRSGTLVIDSTAGDRDTPLVVTLVGEVAGVPCPGDWNGDGVIDFNDLLEYLNDYNAGAPRADLNGDGIVDFNDLLEYLNLYNTPC